MTTQALHLAQKELHRLTEAEVAPIEVKVESEFGPWARRAMTLLLCLGALGLMVNQWRMGEAIDRLDNQLDSIQVQQAAGEQRAYIARAKSCQILNALTVPLDDTCLDARVTAYYDPDEVLPVSRQDLHDLLCVLITAQGLADTGCA